MMCVTRGEVVGEGQGEKVRGKRSNSFIGWSNL